MSIEQIVFYVFAAIVLSSAVLVVATKNLVRSIFMFFITLFSMAGLFVFALADFVAITQIVIYVGGVLVLMIFAFLLSNKQILDNPDNKTSFIGLHHLPGIVIAILFLVVIGWSISLANVDHLEWIKRSASNTLKTSDNTTHYIGINLMTRYLLPFEVVSVFLLMALIGAAHVARKDRKE